jgi:hypothetical protein
MLRIFSSIWTNFTIYIICRLLSFMCYWYTGLALIFLVQFELILCSWFLVQFELILCSGFLVQFELILCFQVFSSIWTNFIILNHHLQNKMYL